VINKEKHLLKFSGKIDIYDTQTKTLYDYKTISDFVKPDLLPRPHHVVQTNIYSYLLLPTYKVERIVIVYIAMNNVYEMELEPKSNDEVLDFIRNQLAKLRSAVTQNIVPEATPNGFCKMCMFKQKCFEIDKLIKKFSNL
jgi:CRISPR/Cas system-associated exonuclease Cas4 (RecB family)